MADVDPLVVPVYDNIAGEDGKVTPEWARFLRTLVDRQEGEAGEAGGIVVAESAQKVTGSQSLNWAQVGSIQIDLQVRACAILFAGCPFSSNGGQVSLRILREGTEVALVRGSVTGVRRLTAIGVDVPGSAGTYRYTIEAQENTATNVAIVNTSDSVLVGLGM